MSRTITDDVTARRYALKRGRGVVASRLNDFKQERAAKRAAKVPDAKRPGSLETKDNIVTRDPETRDFHVHDSVVCPCGCRSWFCERCAIAKGIEVRSRLQARIEGFTDVLLLTLTLDPKEFKGPLAAWRAVKRGRWISRVMRDLFRSKLARKASGYFYVVEWQGNGMPHYHILVDARFIPHKILAAISARIGFGFVFISKRDFGSKRHAANYATKYLTKRPKHAYPAWVMNRGKSEQVRRYDVSKGFWGTSRPPSRDTGETRQNTKSTYYVRVQCCGNQSSVFGRESHIDKKTGEMKAGKLRWMGTLGVNRDELARWNAAKGTYRSVPTLSIEEVARTVREFCGLKSDPVVVARASRIGDVLHEAGSQ